MKITVQDILLKLEDINNRIKNLNIDKYSTKEDYLQDNQAILKENEYLNGEIQRYQVLLAEIDENILQEIEKLKGLK